MTRVFALPSASRLHCADYRLDVEVPVPYYTEWELPNINATPVAFADKRKVRLPLGDGCMLN